MRDQAGFGLALLEIVQVKDTHCCKIRIILDEIKVFGYKLLPSVYVNQKIQLVETQIIPPLIRGQHFKVKFG